MNPMLAALAVALAVTPQGLHGWKWRRISLISVISCLLPIGVAYAFVTPRIEYGIVIGYVLGAFLALLGAQLLHVSTPKASCASALALAALGRILISPMSPTAMPNALMSLIIGAAVTAFILDSAEDSAVFLLPVALSAIVCVDWLGPWHLEPAIASHGALFSLMASAVAAIGALIGRFAAPKAQPVLGVLTTIALAGLYWMLARQWAGGTGWSTPWADLKGSEHVTWQVLGSGLLAGLVVHWFWPSEDKPDAFHLGVTVVIWCGLATLGFGVQKDFGVALATLGVAGALFVMGNPRAVSSLAPLVILALYRVFREAHPDVDRAIDIGQHYAVVGLILGGIIPNLPLEWLKGQLWPEGRRSAVGILFWVLVVIATPTFVAILLGERGLTGMVVGLAISPLVGRLQDRRSWTICSLSILTSATIVLSYGRLGKLLELSRDDKVHALIWPAVALLVAAIAFGILHKPQTESSHAAA